MYEIRYETGGNSYDKNMKLLTYEEAGQLLLEMQDVKTYNPICSMRITKEKKPYRSLIYFNFQVIAVDLDLGKQIWYEKVDGREEYFIYKIVYEKHNGENAHIELHLRNRDFSDPNICMIKELDDNDHWEYYAADIEDTLFYRRIVFGETEVAYKDLETNFRDYLQNVQKCDKRFVKKPR